MPNIPGIPASDATSNALPRQIVTNPNSAAVGQLVAGTQIHDSAKTVEDAIKQGNASLDEILGSIQDLEAQDSQVVAGMRGVRDQISALQGQVAALDPKDPNLQQKQAALASQMAGLNKQLGDMSLQHAANAYGMEQLRDQRDRGRDSLQQLGQQLPQAKAADAQANAMDRQRQDEARERDRADADRAQQAEDASRRATRASASASRPLRDPRLGGGDADAGLQLPSSDEPGAAGSGGGGGGRRGVS